MMDALEQARRIAGRISGDVQNQTPQPGYTPQPQTAQLKPTWVTHSFIDTTDKNIKWIAVNRRNWRKRTVSRVWKTALAIIIAWFVFLCAWTDDEWHIHVDGLDVKAWSERERRAQARAEFIIDHYDEWADYYSPEPGIND